jgi:hypothetical protein
MRSSQGNASPLRNYRRLREPVGRLANERSGRLSSATCATSSTTGPLLMPQLTVAKHISGCAYYTLLFLFPIYQLQLKQGNFVALHTRYRLANSF